MWLISGGKKSWVDYGISGVNVAFSSRLLRKSQIHCNWKIAIEHYSSIYYNLMLLLLVFKYLRSRVINSI